mgnify:CR=1 FL=1
MPSAVLTTAASARLESLFRKLYTVTVALSGIEVVAGVTEAHLLQAFDAMQLIEK